MEDKTDDDSVGAAKYNECWRQARVYKEVVEQRACEEVEHCQVEE